jgi:hypothetical protein
MTLSLITSSSRSRTASASSARIRERTAGSDLCHEVAKLDWIG